MDKVNIINGQYVKKPDVTLWDATYAVAEALGGRVLGVSPNYGLIEGVPGKGDVCVWMK